MRTPNEQINIFLDIIEDYRREAMDLANDVQAGIDTIEELCEENRELIEERTGLIDEISKLTEANAEMEINLEVAKNEIEVLAEDFSK